MKQRGMGMAVMWVLLSTAQPHAQDQPMLSSQQEKTSYGIGVDIARNFKRLGLDFDADILIRGFKDALADKKLLMTEDDLRATMDNYQNDLRQRQVEAMKTLAEKNKQEGEAFLSENKTKEGVVTLPSGLQYKILKVGDGTSPKDEDTVVCHYRGTLIDGTEFDSSYRRGQPAAFRVSGVIPGWTEALKLMPVGSKWQLFLPPQLAYGERGVGRDIGPNATLLFEVELLGVN